MCICVERLYTRLRAKLAVCIASAFLISLFVLFTVFSGLTWFRCVCMSTRRLNHKNRHAVVGLMTYRNRTSTGNCRFLYTYCDPIMALDSCSLHTAVLLNGTVLIIFPPVLDYNTHISVFLLLFISFGVTVNAEADMTIHSQS